MEIIKVAGIEFTRGELEELLEKDQRVIFKYRKVYVLRTSKNIRGNFYAEEVPSYRLPKTPLPWTRRGRYVTMNFKSANELIGKELFVEV